MMDQALVKKVREDELQILPCVKGGTVLKVIGDGAAHVAGRNLIQIIETVDGLNTGKIAVVLFTSDPFDMICLQKFLIFTI